MRTEVSLGRYVLKRELHSRYCCDGLHQFALRNAMHTFFFLGKADQSLICEHPLFFFSFIVAIGPCGTSGRCEHRF